MPQPNLMSRDHRGCHEVTNDLLLLALAYGSSIDAAAKQCGLHQRTVYRRLQNSEFKKRLDAVRSGMLTAAAGEMVRTFPAPQKESVPPPVRLGAARAILEVGMKLRQMAELEVQVRELEERVEALQTDEPASRW